MEEISIMPGSIRLASANCAASIGSKKHTPWNTKRKTRRVTGGGWMNKREEPGGARRGKNAQVPWVLRADYERSGQLTQDKAASEC